MEKKIFSYIIYFENVDIIEVNNSKEAVAEKHMARAEDSYCIISRLA